MIVARIVGKCFILDFLGVICYHYTMKNIIFIAILGLFLLPFSVKAESFDIQPWLKLFKQVVAEKDATIKELRLQIDALQKGKPIEKAVSCNVSKPLTLRNDYGISYHFQDPTLNRQRVQDLVDSGFYPVSGELPSFVYKTEKVESRVDAVKKEYALKQANIDLQILNLKKEVNDLTHLVNLATDKYEPIKKRDEVSFINSDKIKKLEHDKAVLDVELKKKLIELGEF